MSDKKNKHIQDRGWDDMRFILDEKLPVKKKKRRFGFWLLLGAAAMTIVFAAVLMLEPESNSKSQVKQLETSKADNNNDNLKSAVGLTMNSEDGSISLQENQKNKEESESELKVEDLEKDKIVENTTLSTNSKGLKNSDNPLHLSKEDNRKPSIVIPKWEGANDILINQPSIIQERQISDEPQVSAQVSAQDDTEHTSILESVDTKEIKKKDLKNLINSIDSERSILQSMNTLPTIQTFASRMDNRVFDFDSKVTVLNKRNAIHPYLFAAGSYQSKINGLGYGVGGGVGYGSQDFQVYLEAGYMKSKFDSGTLSNDFTANKDISVVELDSSFPNFIIGAEVSNDLNTFDVSVSNFSELITSTNEINIDFGIRRNIFSKFSLDLGLSYSRLLKASNKSLEFDFGIPSTLQEIISVTGRINSSELYDSGAYSSYDVIPHIGIEYSILSYLKLGVSYNHGLVNLISNTDLDRLSSASSNDVIYRRNIAAKVRFEF